MCRDNIADRAVPHPKDKWTPMHVTFSGRDVAQSLKNFNWSGEHSTLPFIYVVCTALSNTLTMLK